MSLKPPSDDVLLSVLCHYIGAKEVPKEVRNGERNEGSSMKCSLMVFLTKILIMILVTH